ncbi:MAG: hypothetical protein VKL39_08480, partial [Leptolyngbyaceae bacterium]|nr:hypothetical protein [Leptolyngbyaceae bacterium]
MTRAVTHIEQDIEDLEQEVVAIAQELQETYGEYLEVLSEAVKQQVVLTTYHLCTQGYPQRFLKLSLSQRQKLQQNLQSLAKHVYHDLLNPSSLQQLDHPFTEELDGDRDRKAGEREQDVMLRNLSAFVRRVLADDSRSGDDDSSDSDRLRLKDLSDDDSSSDGDRPSARLEAIIIPENFSFDFLSDAQFEHDDDDDDDGMDLDADDEDDLEDSIEF